MDEFQAWCPIMNSKCRMDCGMKAEGDLGFDCAIKVIAEHLAGGSIGIRTYADEAVCVTTDNVHTGGGFNVDVDIIGSCQI